MKDTNLNKQKPKELVFTVQENDELLAFIMKKMNGISRNKAKKILSDGVTINNKPVSQFDLKLEPGMKVMIGKPNEGISFKNRWVRIVYEDQYLFVVDKRNGILSNSPNPDDDSVQNILNYYLEKNHQRCHAHTVHRLDRDTSGLMLFSKSKELSMKFEENWKETVYDRRYVALVHGEMKKESGTVSSWLKDNYLYVTYSSKTDNGGKFAVTHYSRIKTGNDYSLVELQLETGRKNQIRVHLQDIGYPVVGDPKYGDGDDSIGRLALHAYKLCFIHPITGENMKFETEIPKAFYKMF